MKRDNGKSKNNGKNISKAKLIFGLGVAAFGLISQCCLVYKEKQGNLFAAFPEAENEIAEAIESVRREREAQTDE